VELAAVIEQPRCRPVMSRKRQLPPGSLR
jgi:hypothetical protein